MYKIVGTDGRQYGPITAEQVRQWIAESRIENRTPVFPDGAKDWTFIGLLPEFAACFQTTPPTITPAWQQRGSNTLATFGLICGILSWVLCCCCYGFPCNLLGLVFSLIALAQINNHPKRYDGRGTAIAGLVLSILSLLFFGFLILFSIVTNNVQVNNVRF